MKYSHPFTFRLSVVVLLLLGGLISKGQYVTIPDANFVNYLTNNGFGSCMSGNQMDTTCSAINTRTSLNLDNQNFRNLDGIQYFSHLTSLSCQNSHTVIIPALPAGLVNLIIGNDSLVALPPLPQGLQRLYCNGNYLTGLPVLPQTLKYLSCGGTSVITTLSALPNGLDSISCGYCYSLTSIPSLPDSLNYLYLYDPTYLTSLPPLPVSLTKLVCNLSGLHSFPALPASLSYFDCSQNNLDSLPVLPPLLQYLYCQGAISSLVSNPHLPLLPAKLVDLRCTSNRLTFLPPLSDSLAYIDCSSNLLTFLPPLKNNLTQVWCGRNKLASLPPLANVTTLVCDHNPLTWLPALPAGLSYLNCSYDSLQALPPWHDLGPNSYGYINCSYNPNLHCLPLLNRVYQFIFNNTGVTCVPNYAHIIYQSNPVLTSLPLCDLFDTTGCPYFWNISGHAYADTNTNCVIDGSSTQLSNIKITLSKNGLTRQQTLTRPDGVYTFKDSMGAYALTVDTAGLPFNIVCPANKMHNDTLTSADSLFYNQDFFFTCKPGFDVGVRSISGLFRPGTRRTMEINAGDMSNFYGAHCADSISGTVTLIVGGLVHYLSPASGALAPSLVNGDTITWNIANFGATSADSSFNFNFVTDSSAQIGQSVCVTAIVTPTGGDYNPSNNILTWCAPVVNSFDPNEKDVYPTHIDSAGQWLTYTIRFQNTGTAPALNIRVTDTLDSHLDPSTFQLIAYSAKNITQLFSSAVVFNFPNINLPDSATSDSASRGYVQYRIKTASPFNPAEKISNTAFIYFDLNPAVVTNTVVDSFAAPLCTTTYDTLSHTICQGDTYNGHSVAGTYTDTLQTLGTGCDSIVTINLTVNALPVVTFNISNHEICSFVTDTITFTGSALNATNIYLGYDTWTYVVSASPNGPWVLNWTLAGNHPLAITVFVPGCAPVTDTGSVSVYAPTAFPLIDTTLCGGGTIQMGDAPMQGYTYNWSPSTGLNNAAISNPTFTFPDAGTQPVTYHYTYTITHGVCTGNAIETFTVNPVPRATLSWEKLVQQGFLQDIGDVIGDTGICIQQYAPSIPLTGGSPSTGTYSGLYVVNNSLLTDSLIAHQNSTDVDTITYTVNELGCISKATNKLFVEICGSINALTTGNNITLYPNPATNQLFIKTENIQPVRIAVYDVDGRVIFTQPFTNEININHLSSGLYFIEVNSKEGVGRKKFVKM